MVVGYSLGNKSDVENEIQVLGEDDTNIVTFSRALMVSLTRMCRNDCGYCGFHRKDNLTVPYSTIKLAKMARANGAREVLYAAGERPDKFPQIRATLDLWGFDSYLEYLYTVCELGFLEGLIPVIEVGFLSPVEMKKLSEICAVVKIMLDSVDESSYATVYPRSPGKKSELRLKSLAWAGKIKLPASTGILVGIGETKEHRRDMLKQIAEIHKEYGMIQEVVIQNFIPEKNTPFEGKEPPTKATMLDTVEMALEILQSDINVVVPIESNPDIADFIRAGIRDIGRLTEGPRQMFPQQAPLTQLQVARVVEELGFSLQQRFPLRFNAIKEGKYSKKLGQVFDAYRYKIKKDEQEKVKNSK